jgi:hypothetical protein
LKLFHVKDVQKVQQHQKSLNKCTILLDDRRMKVREIAETIGISKEGVPRLLTTDLLFG